ncbi:MAG: hypothetical protein QW547_04940 [Candidatus Bathyarchaeia archaeon]
MINLIFAVAISLTLIGIEKFYQHAGLGARIIVLSLICTLLDVPLVYVVVVIVLGLSIIAYLVSLPIYATLQLIPITLLSYEITRRLIRLRIFQF